MRIAGFSIPQKKIANNRENDHASFNVINRVSNPSALAKITAQC